MAARTLAQRIEALPLGAYVKGTKTNGSRFSGYLTAKDSEQIELTTAAKGTFSVPIASIKQLTIGSSGCGCR